MNKLVFSLKYVAVVVLLASSTAFAQLPSKADVAIFVGENFATWSETTEHFDVTPQQLTQIMGFNDVGEAYFKHAMYHVTCYTAFVDFYGTVTEKGADLEPAKFMIDSMMSEYVEFIPPCAGTPEEIELSMFVEFWTVHNTPSVPWYFGYEAVVYYPPGFEHMYLDIYEYEWLGYDDEAELQPILMELTEQSMLNLIDNIFFLITD